MGYSVYYGFPGKSPEGGPYLASGSGWVGWCDFVLTEDGDYPECAALAENGFSEPGDGLAVLDAELKLLLDSGDLPENLKEITETLRESIREKPDGCPCVIVSDGTEPGDEGEEGDGEEDDDE